MHFLKRNFRIFAPFFILCCTLYAKKGAAQTLRLEYLVQIKDHPAKQSTSMIINQGAWQIESASKDSQLIVFSPVNPLDTYELIEVKRKSLHTISYYTKDKAWFDTLKREAIRMQFKLLNKETPAPSEAIHTLQKDSAFVAEFHQTSSGMEIHIFSYQEYFRSFFISQDKSWSKDEQYAFMVKCMSKMPQKLPYKAALKACGCGGNIVEKEMKYKFVQEMNIQEMLLLIKPCIRYYEKPSADPD